jgi:hypothetical protein
MVRTRTGAASITAATGRMDTSLAGAIESVPRAVAGVEERAKAEVVDHDIARLISLATLALAACPTDDDDPTTTHGAAATAQATASGGSTGDTSGNENVAPTGDAPELCQGYADHFAECIDANDYWRAHAEGQCTSQLAAAAPYGDACLSAAEDLFVCLSALDCAAFGETGLDCAEERDAMQGECSDGGGESSSSSSE